MEAMNYLNQLPEVEHDELSDSFEHDDYDEQDHGDDHGFDQYDIN